MLTTIGHRIEQSVRRTLPLITTLLFLMVGVMSWPLPYVGEIKPSLCLIAIYYWSIHRPDLFGPLAAFVLGVLHDALHGLPIGLTAFVFVAVNQLVLSQRRFFVGHAFYMLWTGFAIIMLLVMLGNWLMLSAVQGQWMSFLPALIQGTITAVIFPLLAWLLIYVQRTLLSQV